MATTSKTIMHTQGDNNETNLKTTNMVLRNLVVSQKHDYDKLGDILDSIEGSDTSIYAYVNRIISILNNLSHASNILLRYIKKVYKLKQPTVSRQLANEANQYTASNSANTVGWDANSYDCAQTCGVLNEN